MKFKLYNLYECTFKSDREVRTILVSADTFGRAACLALSVISGWDNSDSYELRNIYLKEEILVSSNY